MPVACNPPDSVPVCSNVRFSTETFSSEGNRPIGIDVADVTQDGVPDIVVANRDQTSNSDDSRIIVFAGQGNGALGDSVSYFVDNGTAIVAVGDLDDDGMNDVVSSNQAARNIGVSFGQVNGRLSQPVLIACCVTPDGLALTDTDNNGTLDIVVSDAGDGAVAVIRNNGDRNFLTPVLVDALSAPRDVGTCDLNGDGCQDLIVTDNTFSSSSVSIYDGFCDGTFAPQRLADLGVKCGSVEAETGDFDTDGNCDVVVTCAGSVNNVIVVLFGTGDGGFRSPETREVGRDQFGVAVGDIDQNGIDDIVTASLSSGIVTVFLHMADGSMQTMAVPAGDSPDRVTLGDLDCDGYLDIAVTNFTDPGSVTVLRNRCGD